MKSQALTLIIVAFIMALAGGAVGYFIGAAGGTAGDSGQTHSNAEGHLIGRAADPELRAPGAPENSEAKAGDGAPAGIEIIVDAGEARSIDEILQQPGPMGRWKGLLAFAETADEAAIGAALEQLREMPTGIDAIVAKFFLYSKYSQGDPQAALQALTQMEGVPDDEVDLARVSILGGWAGQDPKAAADYLLARMGPEGEYSDKGGRVLHSVVDEWARTDPRAALEWSSQLEGAARQKAINGVLGQWSNSAPRAAAAFAQGLAPGEERSTAFQTVAEKWAGSDYRAALQWAESLPPEENAGALGKAVERWSLEDPVAAATYVQNELPPGNGRDRALRTTAVQWSKEDPASAADWVIVQEENDSSRKALRDVMKVWADEDSLGASQWLANQEPGPAIDSAIVSLTNEVLGEDPEAAAIWATTISNPISRALQVKAVARSWLKREPDAASTWIETADISEKMKDELLGQ